MPPRRSRRVFLSEIASKFNVVPIAGICRVPGEMFYQWKCRSRRWRTVIPILPIFCLILLLGSLSAGAAGAAWLCLE